MINAVPSSLSQEFSRGSLKIAIEIKRTIVKTQKHMQKAMKLKNRSSTSQNDIFPLFSNSPFLSYSSSLLNFMFYEIFITILIVLSSFNNQLFCELPGTKYKSTSNTHTKRGEGKAMEEKKEK